MNTVTDHTGDLPSISPHWQNRHSQDWVTLIELLRDSWLVHFECDPVPAIRIAQSWFDRPYPTFKRLALYAASQDDAIESDVWVKWLVDENVWWLWSIQTQRENNAPIGATGTKTLTRSNGESGSNYSRGATAGYVS